MRHTLTIAKRELLSLFYSPIGYVVLGLFSFGAAIVFARSFEPGAPATLREPFQFTAYFLIFLAPAISMRLISEENRSGSIELLVTAPVADSAVVLGKWVAALTFFLTLLTPFVVFWIVYLFTAKPMPDWGPFISGMVGLMLVGGFYLAIGTFTSALTNNQTIAFLIGVFIICALTFLMEYLPRQLSLAPKYQKLMFAIDVNRRYADFARGLIDLTHVVYFASGSMLFLFLAGMIVQSRRWR